MKNNDETNKNNDEIKFYKTGDAYDFFSNVTDIGFEFNLNGERYTPTCSEAVYQGIKGITNTIKDSTKLSCREKGYQFLRDTSRSGSSFQSEAKDFANTKFMHPKNFEQDAKSEMGGTIKEKLMYDILLCKVTQNPSLLKALLDTKGKTIIENTQGTTLKDSFWGNSSVNAKQGRNALGECWMRIRDELSKELEDNKEIQVRHGLSQEVCKSLTDSQTEVNLKSEQLKQDEYITQGDLDKIKKTPMYAKDVKGHTLSFNKQKSSLKGSSSNKTPFGNVPLSINHYQNLATDIDNWTKEIEALKDFSYEKNEKNKTLIFKSKDEQNTITVSKESVKAEFSAKGEGRDEAIKAMVALYLKSCGKNNVTNHEINSENPDLKKELVAELANQMKEKNLTGTINNLNLNDLDTSNSPSPRS